MENIVYDLEKILKNNIDGETGNPACEIEDVKTGSVAVLKETVCYIVSAVVLQEGRVLMMKEAKASCRGKWYLPAGKLEKNESLEEGAIREVLEETGLQFQPTSLLCIDSRAASWFRFTFLGHITGGKLKTSDEQDAESLEAGWFSPQDISFSLQLRARDILPLIDAAIKWFERKQANSLYKMLPTLKPHRHVGVRLVTVKALEENNSKTLEVLVISKKENGSQLRFPFVVSHFNGCDVSGLIRKALREADSQVQFKAHGYLNVEHSGKPPGNADGLYVTVLVEVLSGCCENLSEGFLWFPLEEQNLTKNILQLMEEKGCVDINLPHWYH